MQGIYRQTVHQQNSKGARPKSTIKFENDYDFEQANNKFEELRQELAKLKVGEDAKPEQVDFLFLFTIMFAISQHIRSFGFCLLCKPNLYCSNKT